MKTSKALLANFQKKKKVYKRLNYNSITLLNCPKDDGVAYIRVRLYGYINRKGGSHGCQITISDCENKALLHG